MIEQYPAQLGAEGIDTESRALISVPQDAWPQHAVLRRARLNSMGDGIEWAEATFEQLPFLREIVLVTDDGVISARLAAEFNFDRFIDASTQDDAPAQPFGHLPDRRRFYTRVTQNGFHVVGVFSAATINGKRRYFQWLAGAWVEIDIGGFLYVRDDLDTHFSEVSAEYLDQTHSGATAIPMVSDGEQALESVQDQYVGEPPAQTSPEPVPVATVKSESVTPVRVPAHRRETGILSASASGQIAPTVPHGAIQRGIAIALASVELRDDVDANGDPMIDHAARVAETFDVVSDNIRHCVAWLHDVLERSDLTDTDLLNAGLMKEIVEVTVILTRRSDMTEDAWLTAIASNPDAHAVKLAAIADNAEPWRLDKLERDARTVIEESLERARVILTPESVL